VFNCDARPKVIVINREISKNVKVMQLISNAKAATAFSTPFVYFVSFAVVNLALWTRA